MNKRMNVGLTEEQIEFLDKLRKCCRYSGGKRLSKSTFVRCFIKVIRELDIDLKGIKTEKELEKRFSKALDMAKSK